MPPTNGIVAQIFGTKYLSTLFGIVFLSHQVGSFLGAFLGGYFYDLYGSYDYAWYLAIALSGFAALVHLPIDERPIIRSPITSWLFITQLKVEVWVRRWIKTESKGEH